MAEPEHPAAKAGRFLRAAGLAVQKGVEAGANASKQSSDTSPGLPAPAKLPPGPRPLPPPPVPTHSIVGRFFFFTFLASLAAFLLVVLHVEMAFGGSARKVFQLVLAGIMLLEAYFLAANWQRANERLVQRLGTRLWGPRAAMNRREKVFARLTRDGLTLVGIIFLAAGVFELLGATVGY